MWQQRWRWVRGVWGELPGAGLLAFGAGPAVPAQEPALRLISQSQYVNTISRIFGPDIAVKIRFAPVNRVDGLLAVGASTAVDTGELDPLERRRARSPSKWSTAHRAFLVPCTRPPDARDDARERSSRRSGAWCTDALTGTNWLSSSIASRQSGLLGFTRALPMRSPACWCRRSSCTSRDREPDPPRERGGSTAIRRRRG